MQELFVQTDKKIIATLPRYTFDGRIVVVQSESEAERAVQYLSRNVELGIDTETRPSFRKGQQHKVALLQVAIPDLCFLFRLNYMGLPNALAHLLENGEIKKNWPLAQRRCAAIAQKKTVAQTAKFRGSATNSGADGHQGHELGETFR